MAHLAYRRADAGRGRDASAEFGVSVLPQARAPRLRRAPVRARDAARAQPRRRDAVHPRAEREHGDAEDRPRCRRHRRARRLRVRGLAEAAAGHLRLAPGRVRRRARGRARLPAEASRAPGRRACSNAIGSEGSHVKAVARRGESTPPARHPSAGGSTACRVLASRHLHGASGTVPRSWTTLPWIACDADAALDHRCSASSLLAWSLWLSRALGRRKPRRLPTEWALAARPVFSTDERRVYRLLREALPHHIVLSKLPLVRFCQPTDPSEVRYWYELLGSIHVTFAVCSANGRVLAAIDLDTDRGNSRRVLQIKQSVLGACRVRYLRCPVDHLPSVGRAAAAGAAARRAGTRHRRPARRRRPTCTRRAIRWPARWPRGAPSAPRSGRTRRVFQDSFFAPDSRARRLRQQRVRVAAAGALAAAAAAPRRHAQPSRRRCNGLDRPSDDDDADDGGAVVVDPPTRVGLAIAALSARAVRRDRP